MRALLGLTLLAPSLAFALGRVRFGSEFTFYDPKVGVMEIEDFTKRIVPSGKNYLQRMRDHLITGQPEGQKFVETTDYSLRQSKGRFTSPNGWWYEWGYDDSVVEIKSLPESPAYYRQFKADMQDAIFVSAANEGLWPAMFLGGGHINIGLTAFDDNPLLLRNFVVDLLFNHNELFLGVFNYDTNNAASLFVQERSIFNAVTQIIQGFDNGKYQRKTDPNYSFLRDIYGAMQGARDPMFVKWKTDGTRREYSAVNFSHVSMDASSRIELRAVRPQASMDVWVNQITLFEKRMLYLEKIRHPIPIRAEVPVETIDVERHLLNPPVDPQRAIAAFYRYVTESGERWRNHREYLWPKWISDGEVARFESTEKFLREERSLDCAEGLEGK